jgi:UDP-GlcNAc:undecaprenyl-phosphate/decaprenyl-phosphate GlcNAc-1-phosphate transferase
MTTILLAFALALILSLLLTPLSRHYGITAGALDRPDVRKMHTVPIPRTGGIGILLAFLLALSMVPFFGTLVSDMIQLDRIIIGFLLGAALIFSVGLLDDFRPLNALLKICLQIAAASVAFYFGVKIQRFDLFEWEFLLFHNELFSYLVTVFWFLLFINAVNLIDGLDGLAGGVCLITTVIMIVLLVFVEQFYLALLFSILAGSIAGFLPFNFQSEKLFMGDSGSYFLGYMLAGLAIIGSVKSQMGAILLMLFISMGIPLFDVIFSPIRRFFLGKGIFQPDKKHIHHKLLALGLSSRRVVLVLYGATILLCAAALLLVNLRSEQAGFLLIFLGLGAFFFLRSAGYFRSVEYRRFQSFFRDFSDMTGLSKARRNFLDLQLSIQSSPDVDVLWVNICNALEALDLDYAEITLSTTDGRRFSLSSKPLPRSSENGNGFRRAWQRTKFVPETSLTQMHMLKLELPLRNKSHVSYGTLWLIKNLSRSPIDHYTLSRIEHLRRSIIRCLYGLGADSRA